MGESVEVFISYSHKDKEFREKLENHLKILERSGLISAFHSGRILPGTERYKEQITHLNQADIILLLISADFIGAEDCMETEVPRALERHENGEVTVIPIILSPVDWKATSLSRLQPLPANGEAITTWSSQDSAFEEITKSLRTLAEKIQESRKVRKPIKHTENKYRIRVQFYTEDGEISPDEQKSLDVYAENLGLSAEESRAINSKELYAPEKILLSRRKLIHFLYFCGFGFVLTLLFGSYSRVFYRKSPAFLKGNLEGHISDVNSIDFTSDGNTLVTASRDKSIKIWDVRLGNVIGTLLGHSEEVYSVSFSPVDSNLIVSGSADTTIKVWNIATKSAVRTLNGHQDYVNFVSVSPNGKMIVSASYDGLAKVWDVETGENIYTLNGRDGILLTAKFSPNGKILATGGIGKTIKLWDASTGNEIRTLKGHGGDVNWLAFSSDSQSIYSCSLDNTIRHWNVGIEESIRVLTGHVGEVYTIALHPNNVLLASAGRDRKIRIWDLRDGREIVSFDAHSEWIYSIEFSPNGELLASGSGEAHENLKIWDFSRIIRV